MRHTMRPLALAACFAIAFATTICESQASAEDLFSIGIGNNYQIVDTADPTVVTQSGTISGLPAGETVFGLDYRANGEGIFAVTDANNVYNINSRTFVASQVGTTLSPTLLGDSFALDFNPSAGTPGGQLFRIITGATGDPATTGSNRVIDSNTGGYFGAPDKTPVFYPAGDASDGETPNIQGIAYDNNIPGATTTQQYGIDLATGNLVTVANNAGTLGTVGSLGLTGTLSEEVAFDISGDTGVAFAGLQIDGGDLQLYSIDLGNGTAQSLGVIGDGSTVRDFTIISAVPEPSSAVVLMLGLGAICFRRKRSV